MMNKSTLSQKRLLRSQRDAWEFRAVVAVLSLLIVGLFSQSSPGLFFDAIISEPSYDDFYIQYRQFNTRIDRAIAAYEACDYEDAADELTRALDVMPGDTDTLFCRAQAEFAAGHFHEAINDYSAVLEAKPDFMPARFKRAKAREQAGDLVGAVEDLYQVEQFGRPTAEEADRIERPTYPDSYLMWMLSMSNAF